MSDFAAIQILMNFDEVLFQFIEGFTLASVVRIIFEPAYPKVIFLIVNEFQCFHCQPPACSLSSLVIITNTVKSDIIDSGLDYQVARDRHELPEAVLAMTDVRFSTTRTVIAKARKRLWQSAISSSCYRSPRRAEALLAMTYECLWQLRDDLTPRHCEPSKKAWQSIYHPNRHCEGAQAPVAICDIVELL